MGSCGMKCSPASQKSLIVVGLSSEDLFLSNHKNCVFLSNLAIERPVFLGLSRPVVS